jgi:hypothetical protein
VSDLEPQRHRPKKEVAPRHIPQEIVPVPIAEVRDLVRDALKGTSLLDPVARYFSGWALFEPHVRFTPVDDTHTRIELEVVGLVPGTDLWLFAQKRGEIDRFFVAIQDELDRREHWRALLAGDEPAIESGD